MKKQVIALLLGIIVSFRCQISFAASESLPLEVSGPSALTNQPSVVKLAAQRALVAVFVSAKCPCSNSHIGELSQLAKDFPDFSFVAIHSNADEPAEMSMAYFKKVNLPFPVIEDPQQKWADAFRALKTPHAFVVSASGELLYAGGVSNSNQFAEADRKLLREALEDIQLGKDVRTPKGRALGCMISRGE